MSGSPQGVFGGVHVCPCSGTAKMNTNNTLLQMRDRQLIENLLQLDRLLLRPNHTTEQANDSNKTHQLRPGHRCLMRRLASQHSQNPNELENDSLDRDSQVPFVVTRRSL